LEREEAGGFCSRRSVTKGLKWGGAPGIDVGEKIECIGQTNTFPSDGAWKSARVEKGCN